ncbi:MARCKS-related protein 1-A-like [Salvelinus fontinalis]|uniref:MARCKS-related protein 1-A-like n=1 Tax=Salvelinus fontinalis TaxID=8038 RepID=UPI002484D973|nr:MARCKS-related protein 1-A-like [Salvelinus fontinalis]
MGAQFSKGGVAVDGKVVDDPAVAKTNGQENGHVKTNGDVSAKPGGDAASVDGNGTAEPAKEGETDAIEAAPAAEGEVAKVEGEAAKDAKKKKKKFSLKNSFKGISLKKTKKSSEEEAASPAAEDKPEENGHAAKETSAAEPVAEAKEEATLAPEGEAAAAEAAPAEEAPAEEAAAPAEVTTPAASETEPKTE